MRKMQPTSIVEVLAGTTVRVTWINSGAVPSDISSAIRDKNDTLISSMTAVSSGNGFYYGVHTMPNTIEQWYVNEWVATLDGYPYHHRQFVHLQTMETD